MLRAERFMTATIAEVEEASRLSSEPVLFIRAAVACESDWERSARAGAGGRPIASPRSKVRKLRENPIFPPVNRCKIEARG
jgi:hypothetical protein